MEALIGFWAFTEAKMASQDQGGFLLETPVTGRGKDEETFVVSIIVDKAGLMSDV